MGCMALASLLALNREIYIFEKKHANIRAYDPSPFTIAHWAPASRLGAQPPSEQRTRPLSLSMDQLLSTTDVLLLLH